MGDARRRDPAYRHRIVRVRWRRHFRRWGRRASARHGSRSDYRRTIRAHGDVRGDGDLDKPPDSILAFRDQSETGEVGSYCYGSVCADAPGIPVPPEGETLVVPPGADLLFDYGGEGRLSMVKTVALPLHRRSVTSYLPGDFVEPSAEAPSPQWEQLRARPEGDRGRITAELPPGGYVISVFLKVSEGGDASYSFRVLVEP